MVWTLHFNCRSTDSIPGQGTKVLQAARHSKKKKKNTSKSGILVIVEFSLLVNYDPTKIPGMNSFRSTFLRNNNSSGFQLTEKN